MTTVETIRQYLGYPASEGYLILIEARLTGLGSDQQQTLETVIDELRRVDQLIRNTVPFAAETFSSSAGGTRQYNQVQRMATLEAEGSRWLAELSRLLELEIYQNRYRRSQGGRLIR